MDSYMCLADLPTLVQLKIVRLLDANCTLQLSQTCKRLRNIVKCDFLTALTLPSNSFSVEDQTRLKPKVLRLGLNFDGWTTPYFLNQKLVFYDGLDLAKIVEAVKIVNLESIVEIFVNLNYGLPIFGQQLREDYIYIQEMFKKLCSLKKFKLAVNCKHQDSVITNIHYKHIDHLMMFSCAEEIVLKLPAFAKQRFGSLCIPRITKRVIVIGPYFGFSGRRIFVNKYNKNITLKYKNGICLYGCT